MKWVLGVSSSLLLRACIISMATAAFSSPSLAGWKPCSALCWDCKEGKPSPFSHNTAPGTAAAAGNKSLVFNVVGSWEEGGWAERMDFLFWWKTALPPPCRSAHSPPSTAQLNQQHVPLLVLPHLPVLGCFVMLGGEMCVLRDEKFECCFHAGIPPRWRLDKQPGKPSCHQEAWLHVQSAAYYRAKPQYSAKPEWKLPLPQHQLRLHTHRMHLQGASDNTFLWLTELFLHPAVCHIKIQGLAT